MIGRPYQSPDPPPLVKARIQETQPFEVIGPFEVTGVDFTYALNVWYLGKERKLYVCLFTKSLEIQPLADR